MLKKILKVVKYVFILAVFVVSLIGFAKYVKYINFTVDETVSFEELSTQLQQRKNLQDAVINSVVVTFACATALVVCVVANEVCIYLENKRK